MKFFLNLVFLHLLGLGVHASERPNIILILSNDVPRKAIASHAVESNTSNIRRLQENSVRYQIAWSMPTLLLSQETLLTGQYPGRSKDMEFTTTIPSLLKQSGYTTLTAGRWAKEDSIQMQKALTTYSFEQHCVLSDSLTNQGSHHILMDGIERTVVDPTEVINTYLSDFLQKVGDSPFFLFYPMLSGDAAQVNKQPNHSQSDRVKNVDRNLGQLLKALDDNNLTNNTLLIFTVAHGFSSVKQDDSSNSQQASNRGTNESVHVPFIVQAPFLSEGQRVTRDLVDFTDVFPTLLEVTNTTRPAALELDGRSLLPSLKGNEDPFLKRNWIYAPFEKTHMIRDWQHFLDSHDNFHDLIKDPLQTEAVSPLDKQAPGRRLRLEILLQRFMSKLNQDEQSAK